MTINNSNSVLVTGGAGYIGSHTVVKLIESGNNVVIFDNLSNSKANVVKRIQEITGIQPELIIGDIRDRNLLRNVFEYKKIQSVIHFAGLKAVGESFENPLLYYDNNVGGSIVLFDEMRRADVLSLVFSSSATVYGDPGVIKYAENLSLNPVNVYGYTKLIVENVLKDLKYTNDKWRIAILRYFNPVGAHVSGLIGEDPTGVPNNLMPLVSQVAIGLKSKLQIFGSDYDTLDGTAKRDFIHIDDLASGHLAALQYIENNSDNLILNLGTGKSYSVLELVNAFEKVSKSNIPYEIVSRRPGDLPEYYANPSQAKRLIGWEAKHGLERMCEDTWRWQSMNPNGY
jgi:UDP-glucose 4-epimerase